MNYWNTGGRPPESNTNRDNLLISRVIGFFFNHFIFNYLQYHCSSISWLMKTASCLYSVVWLFETPCTEALQAPLSIGFSRQEYWSGLPCPPPGDLPNPGMEPAFPVSPALQEDSFPLSHQGCHGGFPVSTSVLQTESHLWALFNTTRASWGLMKYLVQRGTRLI